MLYLLLTGGEPFLHPQFRQIMEGLHQMGFLISVNSNGTMINEDTVAWLKNCPPMRLNISLYGASDETYARLCGNPKGFTQVRRAIRLLREAGISVKLNCSLTPHNAADLPEMAAFAKENNLFLQVATYMFPPLRRDVNLVGQNDRLSPREAALARVTSDFLRADPEWFLAQTERYRSFVPLDQKPWEMGELYEKPMRCRAGLCSL
jgi:MoaA/NifB/PqqE/SkfB family radical SAM enzyme